MRRPGSSHTQPTDKPGSGDDSLITSAIRKRRTVDGATAHPDCLQRVERDAKRVRGGAEEGLARRPAAKQAAGGHDKDDGIPPTSDTEELQDENLHNPEEGQLFSPGLRPTHPGLGSAAGGHTEKLECHYQSASTISTNTYVAAEVTSTTGTVVVRQMTTLAECVAEERVECCDEEDENDYAFDPFAFIKSLPPLAECVALQRTSMLPRQTRRSKRKTLVLDLDETLVHSSLEGFDNPDFSFPVEVNNTRHIVNVKMRPHLATFLAGVSSLFEVVIFTASQRIYAEQLLNIIDPQRKHIKHRLYRESCVYVDGNYLKDLSVLGRDLQHTIIVDNSPQAFGFQLSNGIPIESWYDNSADTELLHLLEFLKRLVTADDVRPLIKHTFKLHELVAAA